MRNNVFNNLNVLALFLTHLLNKHQKAELENRAADSGCSLSNYIRLNLGLVLNESGRKKRKVQAAFDLDDLKPEE